MTQQEFEKRTNISTAPAFEYANRVYMAAGQMDKDDFCAEWKEQTIRESDIVSALTLEVEADREAIRNLERQVDFDAANLQKYIDMTADFLILEAEKWHGNSLRDKAIELVGIKKYIRIRMEMKLGLWEEDMEALVEILK